MVEFTDREKRIVHAMNIMNNPSFKDVPFALQTQALQSVLLMCGYTWNEDEMIDLMNAIGAETEHANKSTLGFLAKHGHHLKGLTKI